MFYSDQLQWTHRGGFVYVCVDVYHGTIFDVPTWEEETEGSACEGQGPGLGGSTLGAPRIVLANRFKWTPLVI